MPVAAKKSNPLASVLSLPEFTLHVGPRVAVADRPVADLMPNELDDEHARLCAQREIGRLTPSDIVRLQDIVARIQSADSGYEI
jgi:hypothetical protein